MDMINILPHKRNTTVTVNGTTYKLDGDGVCRGVKDADAAKLLQNREAWREWDGKPVMRLGSGNGPRMGLIDTAGQVIAPPPPTIELEKPEEPEKDADPRKWVVPEDGDWPDPTIEMPIEYLREMADAYDVKFSTRTSKKELIKKINVHMYPDGK